LAAAAAEIEGFVFTQKAHDGSEVYRPAQQVALPHYLASTSLATMPPPPPPPPPRQQQAVATQSPLYTLNAAAAPPPSTLRDATLPPGLHPQVEMEVDLCWAYNRWLTEEVLPASNGRMYSMLSLPFNDPDAALRHVEVFGDRPGVKGFMVTTVRSKTPVHGMPRPSRRAC
jgi:hypothetical protein